jgi:hypothetical protein
MKNIKKVMVCVDFSDYSKKTIEYALAISLARCMALMEKEYSETPLFPLSASGIVRNFIVIELEERQ